MKHIKLAHLLLWPFLLVALGGCAQGDKAYKDYMLLYNGIIEKEQSSLQFDSIFTDIQNEESSLYEEIISLGEESVEDVEDELTGASDLISKGKSLIECDLETVESLQADLRKALETSEKLMEHENYDLLMNMHNLYTERLQQYEYVLGLCSEYLNMKESMYSALASGESLKNVSRIVDEINMYNEDLDEEIAKFNQLTEEYNSLKES